MTCSNEKEKKKEKDEIILFSAFVTFAFNELKFNEKSRLSRKYKSQLFDPVWKNKR